ncbi:M1 family metallopeptidase [Candidatus Zixiibacteriota bacterium]
MRRPVAVKSGILLALVIIMVIVSTAQGDYTLLYEALKRPGIDTQRIAPVEGLVLQRDVGTFRLDGGEVYFFDPVTVSGAQRFTGAIFVGQGLFSFTPPTKIEREQLARFYKEESFQKEFKVLFLRFADGTFEELAAQLSLAPGAVPREVDKEKTYCEKYVLDELNEGIVFSLLDDLSQEGRDGFFYAHISEELASEHGSVPRPVFFICDGHNQEEISFQNRLTGNEINIIGRHRRQTICQFHKQEDYQTNLDLDQECKDAITPIDYHISADIESDGDFSAVAEIELEVVDEQTQMIKFELCNLMSVHNVRNADRVALAYVWDRSEDAFLEEKNTDLIIFPGGWQGGARHKIVVEYGGELLEKGSGKYSLKSSNFWFPRYGYGNRTTFDLTFRTPKELDFISVGKKLDDHIESDVRLSRWVVDEPAVNVSFNMGSFKTHDPDVEGIPPITVFKSEHSYLDRGRRDMEKHVGTDIANSAQLFNRIFGPCPFQRLYVTEIPGFHGESFPGLLHLPWVTYQRGDSEGANELFRAHEVAHQWWGIAAGYKTYHDQWLSEGFAHYAGLWYMQLALEDTERFFELLKNWRDAIFDNRKYVLGSGAEAGPICLGYRTSSSETRGDHQLIVYIKAAYVLHMLRNMCLDLNTMSEDRFTGMLQDYYRTYRGKAASTRDFQKVVEKHLGMDMDWFFQQWIYGTDLPTYRFSHTISQDDKGQYLVHCHVVQQDVNVGFKMFVPMTVHFKGDKRVRLKVLIDQPEMDFTLPALPMEPQEVTFNDFYSVLARVEYE